MNSFVSLAHKFMLSILLETPQFTPHYTSEVCSSEWLASFVLSCSSGPWPPYLFLSLCCCKSNKRQVLLQLMGKPSSVIQELGSGEHQLEKVFHWLSLWSDGNLLTCLWVTKIRRENYRAWISPSSAHALYLQGWGLCLKCSLSRLSPY